MEYKKDFKIKPKEVGVNGVVLFTDGTNDVLPNQLACEAYGYKYDTKTGSCVSFKPTIQLDKQLQEPSNTIKGVSNRTNKGTSRSIINGTLNTTKGFNENCLVSGKGNTINNGINNATVIGAYGKAIRQGELVQGGGGSSKVNEPKRSVVMLTCNTTDNTATNMKVNDLTDEFINIEANSIVGFEIYLTRLEIGGSSGTAGDFSYRHIKGVIRMDSSLVATITTFNSRILGKDGTNGSASVIDTGTNTGILTIQVTGANNVNNIWNAVVYLHETKTNIDIS
tara:strand:+ start:2277 stop:3119 length:843 start_codon:yes stop_codon:yes gene_type:complete